MATTLADIISAMITDSAKAQASVITIDIDEDKKNDRYCVEIVDNGASRQTDTTSLSETANKADGTVESQQTEDGYRVCATFKLSSPDMISIGDMSKVISSFINQNPEARLVYKHQTCLSLLEFDTNEVRAEFGKAVPINSSDVLETIERIIKDNLELIEATI